MTVLPERADVVVVGGGIVGLSAAYHLAAAGVGVVLLERGALGEGSTSKAAGGVRTVFSDVVNVALAARSLDVFEEFGARFDAEIDLAQVGYLFLLADETELAGFAATAEYQRQLGHEARMLDVAEACRLSPLVDPDGLLGAMWSPRAGHCTPEAVVQGYARAARAAGASLVTGAAVTEVVTEDGRVRAVRTSRGEVTTGAVVCAAGAWSRPLAATAGIDLPVRPLRRQVAVTEPITGLAPETPFTIEFGSSFYFHGEGGGLLLGMPEPHDSWAPDLTRDPAWLEPLAEAIARRIPSVADAGLAGGWAGLYEMTPDHNAIIGTSADVAGFHYATGFSGYGFLMGPAVGEVVRDLVLGHRPVVDVSALGVERFTPGTGSGPAELAVV